MSEKKPIRTTEELLEAWKHLRNATPRELAVVDPYFLPEVMYRLKEINDELTDPHLWPT
jgi:hypothetical protein